MKQTIVWASASLLLLGLSHSSGQSQTKSNANADKGKAAGTTPQPERRSWKAPLGSYDTKGKGVPLGDARPAGPKAERLNQLRSNCRGSLVDNGCEGAPIPTGGVGNSIQILSAARIVGADAGNPDAFVFEYQCSNALSYVEVEIGAIENPGIAPRNRGASLIESCNGGRFVWRPPSGLTGDFRGLTVVMIERSAAGPDRLISPLIHAKTATPSPTHRILLQLPNDDGGALILVPTQLNQPAAVEEIQPRAQIHTAQVDGAGEFRLFYVPSPGSSIVPFSLLMSLAAPQ